MAQAVKISDPEMSALRDAARLSSRSISGQAEHWMRIGRAIERDPAIGYSRIEKALRGLEPISLDDLDEDQQTAFITDMVDAPPTSVEEDFWRSRRQRGVGVGLDAKEELSFGRAVRPRDGP